MLPSNKEVEAVQKEVSLATAQLAMALRIREGGEQKVAAARHRLSLARAEERAIIHDMMSYGESNYRGVGREAKGARGRDMGRVSGGVGADRILGGDNIAPMLGAA